MVSSKVVELDNPHIFNDIMNVLIENIHKAWEKDDEKYSRESKSR